MDYEEIQSPDFNTFVMRYIPGTLSHPPWGAEPFDCFIVERGALAGGEPIGMIAREVAGSATEWVETLGRNAELLHDAVDVASVEIGRQARVGDGVPMTAWHEEMESIDSIVDYVRHGGLGSCSIKAVLVLGSEGDVARIAAASRKRG